MSDEIDKLLGIKHPSSDVEGLSENHEGHIQKHTTGWAFLGWILVIAGAWFLYQGFAIYADATNPGIIAASEAMRGVHDAANELRRSQGEPMWPDAPSSEGVAEASRQGWIGGALSIVGLGLAFGTSIFRCSECGGKVAMKTAKICPSCGTSFAARK